MSERTHICGGCGSREDVGYLVDATIAALQARVQELEQWVQDQSTANLETMRHTDEMQSRALEAEQQLTQRTAALEAVNKHQQLHDRIFARQRDLMAHYVATIREAIRRLGNSTHSKERPEPYESRTPVIAAFLGQALGVTAEEAERERVNLQAELERVRALIKALPKVEGEIEIYTGKNTNQVVVTYKRGVIIGTLYGLDHAKPVAALYKHRQGME